MAAGESNSGAATLPPWWRQLFNFQRREVRRVVGEMMALRGVLPLLMKPRNGEAWTAQEKSQLLTHLRQLTHLSPYLVFLLLPGSAVLLPIYAWWLDRRRRHRH